jgi:hypothetical protein
MWNGEHEGSVIKEAYLLGTQYLTQLIYKTKWLYSGFFM